MKLLISTSSPVSKADIKKVSDKFKVRIKKAASKLDEAKKASAKKRKILEKAVKDAKAALAKAKTALNKHDILSGVMQLDEDLDELKTQRVLQTSKLRSKRHEEQMRSIRGK